MNRKSPINQTPTSFTDGISCLGARGVADLRLIGLELQAVVVAVGADLIKQGVTAKREIIFLSIC